MRRERGRALLSPSVSHRPLFSTHPSHPSSSFTFHIPTHKQTNSDQEDVNYSSPSPIFTSPLQTFNSLSNFEPPPHLLPSLALTRTLTFRNERLHFPSCSTPLLSSLSISLLRSPVSLFLPSQVILSSLLLIFTKIFGYSEQEGQGDSAN